MFNPDDPEFTRNPYPTFERMRREPPYLWPPYDAWLFSRYEHVAAIMRDDRRFSHDWRDWERKLPAPSGELQEFDRLRATGLFGLPAAAHTRLRKLISPAFTPRALERMRHRVQAIVDEAVEQIAVRDGRFDVTSYADRIPLRAISDVLGVPRDSEAQFRAFGQAVVDAGNPRLSPEERARLLVPFPAGLALVKGLIDARRSAPRDDLMSALCAAEEAGDRLSHDELLSLVIALIAAGSETTVHLICFAVRTLLLHPEQLALVRNDPALLRSAVDEVLRFDSFGKIGVPHFAREDVSIGGVQVRRGQMVDPMLAAALRDPEAFPQPDVFDVRREQTANIAFGTGPHHCVGAALARMEGQMAIATLLSRFPELALDGEAVFAVSPFMRRIAALPVRIGSAASA
jgi:cytochrome P450 enzyme